MRSKTMQKPKKNATKNKGLLKRLLLLLWHDYKWMLLLVVACLLINAVTNVLPSVFLKNITDYIESGLQLGSWSAVQTDVVRLGGEEQVEVEDAQTVGLHHLVLLQVAQDMQHAVAGSKGVKGGDVSHSRPN